jgi:hypothetical protein
MLLAHICDKQRYVTRQSTIGVLFVNFREAAGVWKLEMVADWETPVLWDRNYMSQNIASFTKIIFWSPTDGPILTNDIFITSHQMRRVFIVFGFALCRFPERPKLLEGALSVFEQGTSLMREHAMAQLVEALRYKSVGREFDFRWCH